MLGIVCATGRVTGPRITTFVRSDVAIVVPSGPVAMTRKRTVRSNWSRPRRSGWAAASAPPNEAVTRQSEPSSAQLSHSYVKLRLPSSVHVPRSPVSVSRVQSVYWGGVLSRSSLQYSTSAKSVVMVHDGGSMTTGGTASARVAGTRSARVPSRTTTAAGKVTRWRGEGTDTLPESRQAATEREAFVHRAGRMTHAALACRARRGGPRKMTESTRSPDERIATALREVWARSRPEIEARAESVEAAVAAALA